MTYTILDTKISKIEWARLPGRRDRVAGCNARLGSHGIEVTPPIARITTASGVWGYGWSRITPESAREYIGRSVRRLFTPELGVLPDYYDIEYPIWDLVARANRLPVYAVVRPESYPSRTGASESGRQPYRVPCYDSSIYMNDLEIVDHDEAASLIAHHVQVGLEKGHRNFKIKVGRGAMHMDLEEGTDRDIKIIQAVRETTGPDARIMIDANNGYNFNLAVRVLEATATQDIYWIEEPFHEDRVLYERLREWMDLKGLNTLIADGEGDSSRNLLQWAKAGIIDVVQYDIHSPGFSRWYRLGPELDAAGVKSAPHNWGDPFGNYAACHLSAGIENFQMAEWDDARVPGLDFSTYTIHEGIVTVPDSPGFGIGLDDQVFGRAVRAGGFVVE